jgi:hypothetical protein
MVARRCSALTTAPEPVWLLVDDKPQGEDSKRKHWTGLIGRSC